MYHPGRLRTKAGTKVKIGAKALIEIEVQAGVGVEA